MAMAQSNPKLAVVGSLNTDLVASVDRFPDAGETIQGSDFNVFCGGKGANQAYAAGRMGASVAMLGQVGDDDFGHAQIRNLSQAGVITDFIRKSPDSPTGTAIIGVEKSGENRIIIIPGANGTFSPDMVEESRTTIAGADFLLLQLETPLESVNRAMELAQHNQTLVILDPAPAQTLPDSWYPMIEFITPNLTELGILTATSLSEESPVEKITQCAKALIDRGCRKVIAKMGSRGAMLVTRESQTHWSAPSVKAVDTTAAGDCFNAAFATRLSSGASIDEAGRFAVIAASISTTRPGAQNSIPTLDDIRQSSYQ